MRHVIRKVMEGSIAEAYGLLDGDVLLAINGEDVLDTIDYQALTAGSGLRLTIERDGKAKTVNLQKEDWQSLGLCFDESMAMKPKTCKNKCIFCFIDQMPPKLRSSLYVKDDDWRFSLMMGNYITLTNVDEHEFERILKRKASPLYISVHATDPALRRRMMNNKNAGDLLPRLRKLRDAGIRFHCQLVCCPGFNDGEAFNQTLEDLLALTPAALSVAVVPVGLTKFRQNLTELKPFDASMARALLKQIEPFQERCQKLLGTKFAFASDEFYCLANADLPSAEWYEGYPQIENGVGLLRQFEEQMYQAAEDDDEPKPVEPRTWILVSGVLAAPHIQQFCDRYSPVSATVYVETMINRFFGDTVTVTGLLTGGDVLEQLSPDRLKTADGIFISANMLNHDRNLFLDGMTLDEFRNHLPVPLRIIEDGYDLYQALQNR